MIRMHYGAFRLSFLFYPEKGKAGGKPEGMWWLYEFYKSHLRKGGGINFLPHQRDTFGGPVGERPILCSYLVTIGPYNIPIPSPDLSLISFRFFSVVASSFSYFPSPVFFKRAMIRNLNLFTKERMGPNIQSTPSANVFSVLDST